MDWTGSKSRKFLVPKGVKRKRVEDFEDPEVPQGMELREPPCSLCYQKKVKCTYGSGLQADTVNDRDKLKDACDRCYLLGKKCMAIEKSQKALETRSQLAQSIETVEAMVERIEAAEASQPGGKHSLTCDKGTADALRGILESLPKKARRKTK